MVHSGFEYLNSLALWDGIESVQLESIRKVLNYLDNPQDKVKTIHVAGTNGKGSTSVAIASILGASGYNVGLNISPNLYKINERIIINGREITDESLNQILLNIKEITDKYNLKLTYHECITVSAFLAFQDLDYAVIEVGLGGRLDASNVIKLPEACILTSISLDHEKVLGDTISKIAREKAGIIKEASRVYCGDIVKEAKQVIKTIAKEKKAKVKFLFEDFDLKEFNQSLEGEHQRQNLNLASKVCSDLGIEKEAIKLGISNIYWPARLETIKYKNTNYLLDCAHNEDAFKKLISFLDKKENKFDIVFGALNTKNWKIMIDIVSPYIVHWNIVLPKSEQAVPCNEISEYLSLKAIDSKIYEDDYERVVIDLEQSENALIAGSIYMVGHFWNKLNPTKKDLWKKLK